MEQNGKPFYANNIAPKSVVIRVIRTALINMTASSCFAKKRVLQLFGSIVPKNTNKPERDVTANKRGLFYSKPTLPSLADFGNSFSKGKYQLNYVNTRFRTKKKCFSNIRKLLKTLFP